LDFRGQIMGSMKSRCTTSYRSSIDTVALNCLVFEKIAFFNFATDIETNKPMDSIDPLSRSRCRERRLNKKCCDSAGFRRHGRPRSPLMTGSILFPELIRGIEMTRTDDMSL